MMADGRGALRDHTVKMLHRAVARQMRLPPDQRSLGAVRAFLGFGEDDRWRPAGSLVRRRGGRLAVRWRRGSCPGRCERIIGFDLTQLFGHAACSHVAAYLLQRIRELIDGRRITVICDEVRFYLLNEIFAEAIKDFSLTLRKKNGQLWIAAQEPGHIINSTIGTDLANQAQTMWVYPGPGGE